MKCDTKGQTFRMNNVDSCIIICSCKHSNKHFMYVYWIEKIYVLGMYHDLFDLCFGLYLFQTSNNMYMIPNEYVIKTMFLFMTFCFIFSFYKH